MFRLLRPAARSAFGVHRLRPRTLHAAVRAEHAAIARPGAQLLVAVSALISQECLHGGHHLFPLGPAYRAGQNRNLDCSASHRAVDPAGFRGVIKALILLRSQSCTASHAGIRSPLLAALATLAATEFAFRPFRLLPESPIRETKPCTTMLQSHSGLRNALPVRPGRTASKRPRDLPGPGLAACTEVRFGTPLAPMPLRPNVPERP